MSVLALNVVCCETARRLESGAKRKWLVRAQNVADDPKETFSIASTEFLTSPSVLYSSSPSGAAMTVSSERARDSKLRTKVFISYSRKDMAFADRLEAEMTARGFAPLIDRTEIYAFEDWWRRIQGLVSQADIIVFVLSPDAVASDVCRREISFAASLNKRFAPIVYRRPDDKAVPDELRRLNFISFDDATQFDASLAKLTAALETDIDWIRMHTEFGQIERRWDLAGRPGGLLLRPAFGTSTPKEHSSSCAGMTPR
jgi:hypothetical protein